MRYLTGVTGPDVHPHRFHPRLGLLTQPDTYGPVTVSTWPVWGADNGCFALKGKPFDEAKWKRWLDSLPRKGCLFAAAPDVLHWVNGNPVGDAEASLAWAERYLPYIRSLGFPAALVLQDGMVPASIPWSSLDALFVGGSDAYKLGPNVHRILLIATERGIPAHMGRVNSHRRLVLASAMGCSSADGTFLRTAVRTNLPRMLGWLRKLDQGSQAMFLPD